MAEIVQWFHAYKCWNVAASRERDGTFCRDVSVARNVTISGLQSVILTSHPGVLAACRTHAADMDAH